MIGLSKINERLPDMTRNEMVPDVSVKNINNKKIHVQ